MPSWDEIKRIFRVATVLAIVGATTLLATFVRPDWVGAIAGVGFGLVFGLLFVYVNWAALDE